MKKEKVKVINQDDKSNKSIFHNYLWYIIIFSLIGLIIEAIFGLIIAEKIGYKKGLILGPLCPIYGFGVAIIIAFLNKYKGHKIKLFLYGAILGATIEYIINFILEAIFGASFWNYSWAKLNLNSRICLQSFIIGGILAVLIINFALKYIDKLVNKIQGKPRKIVDTIITILLIIDIIITIWAIAVYTIRAKDTLNGKNYISNNNIIEKFQNTAFSNNTMSKIFPSLPAMKHLLYLYRFL